MQLAAAWDGYGISTAATDSRWLSTSQRYAADRRRATEFEPAATSGLNSTDTFWRFQ